MAGEADRRVHGAARSTHHLRKGSVPVRSFTISSRATGHKRTVKVHVHDSLDEMVRAGETYRRGEDFSGAYGICHGMPDDRPGNLTAVVRYTTGYLGSAVVVHELVHAAQAIYRRDVVLPHPQSRAEVHFFAANEVFAHLVGDLVGKVVNKLHSLGCYAGETPK